MTSSEQFRPTPTVGIPQKLALAREAVAAGQAWPCRTRYTPVVPAATHLQRRRPAEHGTVR